MEVNKTPKEGAPAYPLCKGDMKENEEVVAPPSTVPDTPVLENIKRLICSSGRQEKAMRGESQVEDARSERTRSERTKQEAGYDEETCNIGESAQQNDVPTYEGSLFILAIRFRWNLG